ISLHRRSSDLDVQHPGPHDAARIQSQLVAVVNVVVDQSRQQVVGGADGVDVAGEVQVDLVGGDDAGAPAAGGAALDAKHRPHGRLPQRSGAPSPTPTDAPH